MTLPGPSLHRSALLLRRERALHRLVAITLLLLLLQLMTMKMMKMMVSAITMMLNLTASWPAEYST